MTISPKKSDRKSRLGKCSWWAGLLLCSLPLLSACNRPAVPQIVIAPGISTSTPAVPTQLPSQNGAPGNDTKTETAQNPAASGSSTSDNSGRYRPQDLAQENVEQPKVDWAKNPRRADRWPGRYFRAAEQYRGKPSQQIAAMILDEETGKPEHVTAFVVACSDTPPGRQLAIDVATRAAKICEPDDPALVELAVGLADYSAENPEEPRFEPTVGVIEAVANNIDARDGADAGDAAYASLTLAVVNRTSGVSLTGASVVSMVDNRSVHRFQMAQRYLDYERLVRGLQIYFAANPKDYQAAMMALELGYRSRDKGLAKLGVPAFEARPDLLHSTLGFGMLVVYFDWAQSP